MPADVNRKILDPKETHFSYVLCHQGVSLLPSDLNELVAIPQYYLRQFIIDFVGERWRTAHSFEITVENENFKISKGHFYVDGILCVNEEVECWYSPKTKETEQPMFPPPEWEEIKKGFPTHFAVYLECWEREVNSKQREVIREIALNGSDPSSRLEIAWQVRVLTSELAATYAADITNALEKRSPNPDKIKTIKDKFSNFNKGLGSPGTKKHCIETQDFLDILDDASPTLRVWAKKPADTFEPCSISPDSGYRGLENQLYLVEVHASGVPDKDSTKQKPSFKWSRDNGSIAFKIIPNSLKQSSREITLDVETLGPDRRYGLCVNDWVELTSDVIEFGQKVLPLAKVEKISSNLGRLTLSINTEIETDLTSCTLLRRWDQNLRGNTLNEYGTIDIVEGVDDDYDKGNWILLEHGIKIQFQSGGNYPKGACWLIQARVATGDVEGPRDDKGIPQPRPTDGIKRHRAALAVVINGKATSPSCGCVLDPICKGK